MNQPILSQSRIVSYRPTETHPKLLCQAHIINLHSLYVLFSQFRSREFAFCLFISYARICTWITRQLKETVLWGNITLQAESGNLWAGSVILGNVHLL